MTTDFATAWAARSELVATELATLRAMLALTVTVEQALDARQAKLDEERKLVTLKREQLRLWAEALETLKGSLAGQFVELVATKTATNPSDALRADSLFEALGK